MPTKTKTKKEVHWRCRKCLPAVALAKEGGDENEFYACPVVPPEADTIGVRLIGDEADREEIKKIREK